MDQRMSSFELYERGLVLKRVKMFCQAIEDFRKAACDPKYAGKAYVQMALCLRAVDRHEDAVKAFRQAVTALSLTSEEKRHVLYHMALSLESLGRYPETLEVYGRIRKEDPGFRDVARRIKHLSSGKRGPISQTRDSWGAWMKEMFTRRRAFPPHMRNFLDQTGQWLGWQAPASKHHGNPESASPVSFDETSRNPLPVVQSKRNGQPGRRDHTVNTRRHVRVPVCLRSHFSAKGRMMAGEGELRDLSPWGCRVKSPVAVPIGADLQCSIFPKGAVTPFIIEGATVRWVSREEFGLAFTNVHPGVQGQIAQLCGAQAA